MMDRVAYEETLIKTAFCHVQSDELSFRWAINPYRFLNTRILVKTNASEVLCQELREPIWRGELVAIGTACDAYDPAEQRYHLTRRYLQTLRDFANPMTLTTKSNLILKDLDVSTSLTERTSLTVNVSIPTLNEKLWKLIEPRAVKPTARLEVIESLAMAGTRVGVLLAPVLPGVTDKLESMEAVVRQAVERGVEFIAPNLANLKLGTREWTMLFLREAHPHLSAWSDRLYLGGYEPKQYTAQMMAKVDGLRRRYRLEGYQTIAPAPSRAL